MSSTDLNQDCSLPHNIACAKEFCGLALIPVLSDCLSGTFRVRVVENPPVKEGFSFYVWDVKRAAEELLLLPTNELHSSVGPLLLNCLY